jgi:hypothetical protein
MPYVPSADNKYELAREVFHIARFTRLNLSSIFIYLEYYRHGSRFYEKNPLPSNHQNEERNFIIPPLRPIYECLAYFRSSLNFEFLNKKIQENKDLFSDEDTMEIHEDMIKNNQRIMESKSYAIFLKVNTFFNSYFTTRNWNRYSLILYPNKFQRDLFDLSLIQTVSSLENYTLYLCDLLMLFPLEKTKYFSKTLNLSNIKRKNDAWNKFLSLHKDHIIYDHNINWIPFDQGVFIRGKLPTGLPRQWEGICLGVCMSYLRILFTLSPDFKESDQSKDKSIKKYGSWYGTVKLNRFMKSNKNFLTAYDLSYLTTKKNLFDWWSGVFEDDLYNRLELKSQKIQFIMDSKNASLNNPLVKDQLDESQKDWINNEKYKYYVDFLSSSHKSYSTVVDSNNKYFKYPKEKILNLIPKISTDHFLGLSTSLKFIHYNNEKTNEGYDIKHHEVPHYTYGHDSVYNTLNIGASTSFLVAGMWKEKIEKGMVEEGDFQAYKEAVKKKYYDRKFGSYFIYTLSFLATEVEVVDNVHNSSAMIITLIKGLTTFINRPFNGQYTSITIQGTAGSHALLSYINVKERFFWYFDPNYGSFKFCFTAQEMGFFSGPLLKFKKDQDLLDFMYEDQISAHPQYPEVYKLLKVLITYVIHQHLSQFNDHPMATTYVTEKGDAFMVDPIFFVNHGFKNRVDPSFASLIEYNHMNDAPLRFRGLYSMVGLGWKLEKISEERLAYFEECHFYIKKGIREIFGSDMTHLVPR